MVFQESDRPSGQSFDISQYTIEPQMNGPIPTIKIKSVFSTFVREYTLGKHVVAGFSPRSGRPGDAG